MQRFTGPEATEVFLLCRPIPGSGTVAEQTANAYSALEELLAAEGGSPEHVVRECVFFADLARDGHTFVQTREGLLWGSHRLHGYRPASTWIEQPPLEDGAVLEIAATAVVPHDGRPLFAWTPRGAPPCVCDECAELKGRVFVLGGEQHMFAGNVYGSPGSAYDEARAMFSAAGGLLHSEGMDFRDVVRTWIYLRDMDRDYAELNRARRDFFRDAGVTVRPASTGIQGGPLPAEHALAMGFLAIRSPLPARPRVAEPMSSPTLNEAWSYGSDFSRGLKVVEANKVALYVSGTASVDETGRTAHEEDFDAQADRMLVNISALLASEGASFVGDVVSAVSYVKRPEDAPRLLRILRDRSLDRFPNPVVLADVCRPELLCEMEVVAALPLPPRSIARRRRQ